MNLISTFLIAIALSMDAFAVSLGSGTTLKTPTWKQSALIAFYFGSFQFFMPLIGWFLGSRFQGFIDNYDHWIAFGLLIFIGGKMIYEAFKCDCENKKFSLKHKVLFLLAIATSIDALGIGLSFAFTSSLIFIPSIIIGITTFVFSFFGVFLGKIFGHFLGNIAEIFGGIILFGIAIKILIQGIGFSL